MNVPRNDTIKKHSAEAAIAAPALFYVHGSRCYQLMSDKTALPSLREAGTSNIL